MKHTRRKARQAQRRAKRDVMQNTMVLHGWVPVQLNTQYGIYNADSKRLVLRKWVTKAMSAFPYPAHPRRYFAPKSSAGTWVYECTTLWSVTPFNGTEVTWGALQAAWVRALRSRAMQEGWL
jgi:hypothetical protein